ncbi:MAG: hypothetical protein ACRDJP_10860 [Actinomycetota bacterium]
MLTDEVADREELKADLERVAREAGHTTGPWLEVGHAAQLGCLACDRYAFIQFLPPPPKVHAESLAAPCPDRERRLIQTPD